MKIFVISLKNAEIRRKNISAQCTTQELAFEFFDAVDGRVAGVAFPHYSSWKRLFAFGSPLTNTQLGCFASHYNLWLRCVELDKAIIVLEDDILLANDFAIKLPFILKQVSQLHFLRFCGLRPNIRPVVQNTEIV
ncbi:MAG: glycosyltransferase family 25 protein [Sphingobacteriaceae bacterium]|nr:glycosyltransferase family 25 protein [Sphingobacteriaceae bacterium]